MQGEPRLVEGMADMAVELGILLRLDLVPGPGPEGGGFVDRLAVHLDRDSDVVRIGLDHRAEPGRLQELVLALPQMQADLGAARLPLRLRDRELAAPVRLPGERLFRPGGARDHLHALRHHEGGIEADAELPDQRDIVLCIAGQPVGEGGGAGARDGAEILRQLLPPHAFAIVGDGDGARLLVHLDADAEFGVPVQQFRLGDGAVTQPVAGVCRVRDQFAQEDFLVRINRVHHEVEDASDLRLKRPALFVHRLCPSACSVPARHMRRFAPRFKMAGRRGTP